MKYFKIFLALLASLTLAACAHNAENANSASSENSSVQTSQSASQAGAHQIIVTINGQDYRASLNDSQAAQSIISQLPLEQPFRDYSSSFDEKITDLEGNVSYQADENSHNPQAGDIAYWAPDNRLVFYWGDVAEYSGIHVIGRFDDSSAIEAVRNIGENDQVTIRLAE